MHTLSERLVATRPSPTWGRYVPYFLERVGLPDANGCLPWLGPKNAKGYGVVGIAAKGYSRAAHRFAYAYWVEPVPDGLTIDHLCFNRWCVNPAHMEPVTQAVNASRRRESTSCPAGHEMTPENTYVLRENDNRVRPKRACRKCTLTRQRDRYAKQGRKGRQ